MNKAGKHKDPEKPESVWPGPRKQLMGDRAREVGRGQVIQGCNSQVGVWTVLRTLCKQFSCDPVVVLACSAVWRSDETDRGNRSEGVVP